MVSSKTLAELIGPTLIVIAISKALNFRLWASNIPMITYFVGILLFIAGLAVVRAHNRWIRGWPVVITLLGWSFIFGGLFRMFAPESHQLLQNTPIYGVYIVDLFLLTIGLYLTFEAFWAKS